MTLSGGDELLSARLSGFEIAHPGTSLSAFESVDPPALVIRVSGVLDTTNSPDFQSVVTECLGVAKHRGCLIIDLEQVSYASSAGIGALTALLVETRRHDIPYYLYRIPRNVGAVLDVLGFSSFFDQLDRYEGGK
ncbi:MAG TPA: STAS domain-containing protein [Rectinemataceae bacterium]|nr:STAS domain-containing protein [Rectinemataceae bacterium]